MSSLTEFYMAKGFTPINKTVYIQGTGTLAVWTPITGSRVIITELAIGANIGGTIAFYFDNTAGYKIAEYMVASSASFSPAIGGWEHTSASSGILAKVGISGTDNWRVNMTGFEIPSTSV